MARSECCSVALREEVVAVGGTIDASCCGLFVDALQSVSHKDVILDLAAVDFLDAGGLRGLLLVHRERTLQGFTVRVSRASPPVLRILRVTGLLELFGVADR
jgi:anti-sigma B factor antagonist